MFKYFVVSFFLFLTFFLSSVPTEALTRSRAEYEKTGHVIWEIKTDEKLISITFDDGPDPVYTPQILDLLDKFNAKATFFVTGHKADTYPELIKRIVKEGHEVGNHTYNHMRGNKIDSKKLKNELKSTGDSIKRITGKKPTLYRPVGGYYNDLIINTAVAQDYLVVMWSWHQDPKDWNGTNAKKIANHITSSARPGDIVLLHDSGGDRAKTVKALESILGFLAMNEYKCVTVSEMIMLNEELTQFP